MLELPSRNSLNTEDFAKHVKTDASPAPKEALIDVMPAKTSECEFRGTAKRASSKQLKFSGFPLTREMTKSQVVQSFPEG